MISRLTIVMSLGLVVLAAPVAGVAQRSAGATKPVIVLTTEKGAIEMELFQADAPKSVAHLLDLFKRGFYTGLRFHRVTTSLVQIGDPQTRNMRLEGMWGTMGSGAAIGVAEVSKTRKHVRGTVGLATAAGPAQADSQFYIMKVASPSLDGKYAIVGQVTKGMELVDKVQRADRLVSATIKAEVQK